MVMDSNALPGWTNRVLARFVDKAAVSFAEALPHFRGKGVLTGNPVRAEFFEIPAKQRDPDRVAIELESAGELTKILVVGDDVTQLIELVLRRK